MFRDAQQLESVTEWRVSGDDSWAYDPTDRVCFIVFSLSEDLAHCIFDLANRLQSFWDWISREEQRFAILECTVRARSTS